MGVQIRVLGPVELWRDAQRIVLAGHRMRGLVALLGAHSGYLTRDTLVSYLWDDPPRTAVQQLYNCVSALRSQLGRHGWRICREGGGYRIEAGPETSDLAFFRRLLDQARASQGAEAIGQYERALALWRGPALADLGGERFARLATGLDELRLTATEEYAELLVRAGEPCRMVADLAMLVQEHPVRERLARCYMLALHGSGRTADALDAFRRLRSRLVSEYGIEPGAGVTSAHLDILRG